MFDVQKVDHGALQPWRKEGDVAITNAGRRPFPSYAHAKMLSDGRRLSAYRAAIDGLVWDGATVVDVGTGTGILASYAAARTSGVVHALDLNPSAAAMAQQLCAANGLDNVHVVNAVSFGRPLDCEPDVLVTETLGPIGVDEHVVEIMYEFCLRYPSLRVLIPSALSVHCVSVRSRAMTDYADALVGNYLQAGAGAYRFDSVVHQIRHALGRSILPERFDDAAPTAAPVLLAQYELGKSPTSRFSQSVDVDESCDGLLLYFSADLGAGQRLSTSLEAPESHWGRSWVVRPRPARRLHLRFEPGQALFHLDWE